MALKNNTWKLNQWYDQSVAGNVEYSGIVRWFTWGAGNYGGSGLGVDGPSTRYSSPVQLPGDNQWSHISSGGYGRGFLGLRTDGTFWGWGRNHKGQLGTNTVTTPGVSSPIQIGTDDTLWSSEFSLIQHGLAIKTDGTLWSWGDNYMSGCLGQNSRVNLSSPTQIPGTTWSKVAAANLSSVATKTDGTLWVWGDNAYGTLGLNDTTQRSSPNQIPGTTWSNCAACGADRLLFGIKTDGTLWAWGFNANNGGLGQNNKTNYSSPVQIPGTTWSEVTGGGAHVTAIKTDGTLWAWGLGTNGILGQNEGTTQYSSPKQIPGTWSQVTAGNRNTFATKTDGTLWGWGKNDYGQLGLNQDYTGERSSPTQVGSDIGWSDPAANANDFFAKKMI